jgi:hypothetical protein
MNKDPDDFTKRIGIGELWLVSLYVAWDKGIQPIGVWLTLEDMEDDLRKHQLKESDGVVKNLTVCLEWHDATSKTFAQYFIPSRNQNRFVSIDKQTGMLLTFLDAQKQERRRELVSKCKAFLTVDEMVFLGIVEKK